MVLSVHSGLVQCYLINQDVSDNYFALCNNILSLINSTKFAISNAVLNLSKTNII